MSSDIRAIIPVFPSQDIQRDVAWYQKHMGVNTIYEDHMYAVLQRDKITIHLQWHADTVEDPLLGGSVLRILVDDIQPIFTEFVDRGSVELESLRLKTDWNTNEFGFFDLNKNAIFICEDLL